MRRAIVAVACVVAIAAVAAGCTHASTPSVPFASPTVPASTAVAPTHVAPVPSGPTTAAAARSCPFLSADSAHNRVGMRLDKITVLVSGGTVIGCRYYPLGHPTAQCSATCLRNEKLPVDTQPAIEITSAHYASTVDAHNAVALLADSGTNPEQDEIAAGIIGVCYQHSFYPPDHGRDWACAFNKNAVVVIVRTAALQSDDALNVAQGVAPKF